MKKLILLALVLFSTNAFAGRPGANDKKNEETKKDTIVAKCEAGWKQEKFCTVDKKNSDSILAETVDTIALCSKGKLFKLAIEGKNEIDQKDAKKQSRTGSVEYSHEYKNEAMKLALSISPRQVMLKKATYSVYYTAAGLQLDASLNCNK